MKESAKLTVNTPRLPRGSINSFVTQRARISFASIGTGVTIFAIRRLDNLDERLFAYKCLFLGPENEYRRQEL